MCFIHLQTVCTTRQYALHYKYMNALETRIQDYKSKCRDHILSMDSSRLAQPDGRRNMDDREDDGMLASEMQQAKKKKHTFKQMMVISSHIHLGFPRDVS